LLKKLQVNTSPRRILLPLIFTCFIACSKDNDNASPLILTGKWKLTSSSGSLDNTVSFKRNDTTIKLTESQTYYSNSAAGLETFSGNSTNSDSIFVHAVITQNNKEYFNDVLYQDTTIVSGLDQTTLDVQSNFEMIGRDSIHFEGPGIPLTEGLIYIGGTQGLKYNISGNTLTLNTYIYINDSSAASVQHGTRTIVNTFTRK
jgi:hypothetical protein